MKKTKESYAAAFVGLVVMATLMALAVPAACNDRALAGDAARAPRDVSPAEILLAQERREETEAPAEQYLRLEDELARKGEEAFEAEDYPLAEQIFRSLVQHNPDDLRGYLGLGKVYLANKQHSSAADAYFEALRLDRNNVTALLGLGRINLALFKWDQAFEFFQEVAEIDESNTEARRYVDNLLHGRLGAEEDLPEEYFKIMLSPAITRAELAALVYARSFGLQNVTSEPQTQIMTDISDNWARAYIMAVTKHKIMSVFPNHTFIPNTAVTRGEFAQVLHNLLREVGLKEPRQGLPPKEIALRDVNPSNRYYEAIRQICGLGILDLVADSTFNPSSLVPGSQAVEAFNRLERLANLRPVAHLPAPTGTD